MTPEQRIIYQNNERLDAEYEAEVLRRKKFPGLDGFNELRGKEPNHLIRVSNPWVEQSPYAKEACELELARCEREVTLLLEKIKRLKTSLGETS